MADKVRLSALFPTEQRQMDKLVVLKNSIDQNEFPELKIALEDIINQAEAKRNVGRPSSVDFEEIQRYKNEGRTQEQISRILNVSVSTVRRHWK